MNSSIIGNIAGCGLEAMLPKTLRDLKKSAWYLLLCIVLYVPKDVTTLVVVQNVPVVHVHTITSGSGEGLFWSRDFWWHSFESTTGNIPNDRRIHVQITLIVFIIYVLFKIKLYLLLVHCLFERFVNMYLLFHNFRAALDNAL
jgi:hypothetical protein